MSRQEALQAMCQTGGLYQQGMSLAKHAVPLPVPHEGFSASGTAFAFVSGGKTAQKPRGLPD